MDNQQERAQAAPAAVAAPRRATKAVQQLGAGDAVFAFASMLTALPRVVPFGSAAWATPGAELATAFNAANGLSVSLDFPSEIVFPKIDGDLLSVIEKAAAQQPASPSYTHADVLQAHTNGYELGAVAGPSEAVAYLDIGAGGYLDLGTDLTDEALSRLPKGRHALVIAGTYGIDGYIAADRKQGANHD